MVESENKKNQRPYPGWIYNILEEYMHMEIKSDIEKCQSRC